MSGKWEVRLIPNGTRVGWVYLDAPGEQPIYVVPAIFGYRITEGSMSGPEWDTVHTVKVERAKWKVMYILRLRAAMRNSICGPAVSRPVVSWQLGLGAKMNSSFPVGPVLTIRHSMEPAAKNYVLCHQKSGYLGAKLDRGQLGELLVSADAWFRTRYPIAFLASGLKN